MQSVGIGLQAAGLVVLVRDDGDAGEASGRHDCWCFLFVCYVLLLVFGFVTKLRQTRSPESWMEKRE